MKDRFFLDTNVLVYTFDGRSAAKQKTAKQLVETALSSQKGFISYQVAQEFLNVASRKFAEPLSSSDCLRYLNQVLTPLCGIFSSIALYERALTINERWRYAFYDSLIIASALSLDCKTLYSEDLQAGQTIQTLTIENPFS